MRIISSIEGIGEDDDRPLGKDDIFHVHDVFNVSELEEVFRSRGYPGAVISDHLSLCQDLSVKFVGMPLFFYSFTGRAFRNIELPNDFVTERCFNFLVNKKQVNRYLLIKLVEIFNLNSHNYTWSGVDSRFDLSKIIDEMNQLGDACPLTVDQRTQLLKPITLSPRWFDEGPSDTVTNSYVAVKQPICCWPLGIDRTFQSTAVSLISETVAYDHSTVFTEKTGYSILGLTFPIWIGGYKQASEFRRMGFDTFDDVIDHSYESYDTLIERCYYAFAKNIDILSNLELAAKLRQQYKERLLKNRSRLLGDTFDNFIDAVIEKESSEVQHALRLMVNYFRLLNP